MTIREKVIKAINEYVEKNGYDTWMSRKEIQDYVNSCYEEQIDYTSFLPTDYCYNRYNSGLNDFSSKDRLLEYKDGQFRLLGEKYPFTGDVWHFPKDESRESYLFGRWENGKFELCSNLKKESFNDEMMTFTGSPEWFYDKSLTKEMNTFSHEIEKLRENFHASFSADMLKNMNGKELLDNVFSCKPNSMTYLLMFDPDVRRFGAAGKYKYLGLIYQIENNLWKYKVGSETELMDQPRAEQRALQIRDEIIECVQTIENAGIFETIQDYFMVEETIKKYSFYSYPWVLKYFQMLFPQYFPGMYADKTLKRAQYVLGLPNHKSRFLNIGEISLFIRKCKVNNIVFNRIYSAEWGWDKPASPCQNAVRNYESSSKAEKHIDLKLYSSSVEKNEKEQALAKHAVEIEKEIDDLHLKGKEKEAVVKIRVNQGEFRNSLLIKNNKCSLCGVMDPALLVASHIKPWRDSEPEEKLDDNNGLLLCPNHDKLFDSGFISFEDNGCIMISDDLQETDRVFMNVRAEMKIEMNDTKRKYMKYHRENIFYKKLGKGKNDNASQ